MLKYLNRGKAAGCDNIPPEAWKLGSVVSERKKTPLIRFGKKKK